MLCVDSVTCFLDIDFNYRANISTVLDWRKQMINFKDILFLRRDRKQLVSNSLAYGSYKE